MNMFFHYRYNVAIKCATITPGTDCELEHSFELLTSYLVCILAITVTVLLKQDINKSFVILLVFDR